MRALLLLTLSSVMSSVVAQPIVTADGAMPFLGYSYTEITASAYMDHPGTGANMVWDFSGLEESFQRSMAWTAIPNQQQQDTWPNAEFFRSGGGGYFSVAPEGVYFHGQQHLLSQLVYQDPELVVKFPMNYGDPWTDEWAGTQTGNGTRVGKRQALVSGYGALILPWGEVNDVLRVDLVDSLVIRVSPTAEPYLLLDTVSQYFKNGYQWWLLEARNSTQIFMDTPTQTLTVKYMDALSTSLVGPVPSTHDGLLLFPNPADELVNVRILDHYMNAMVEVLDATGRSVLQEQASSLARGGADLQLDVRGLASGHYTIRLQGASGPLAIRPFVVHHR